MEQHTDNTEYHYIVCSIMFNAAKNAQPAMMTTGQFEYNPSFSIIFSPITSEVVLNSIPVEME